ncbi:putative Leucine Rich repeat [Trypanosoma vivax]|nr:hypothetical protein TRVL_02297 [Trypanosoma vivax]KAH8611164.1 putative Leucine Rich repeat [Trypanosoma vivax]
MSRTWCPSLRADEVLPFDVTYGNTVAKLASCSVSVDQKELIKENSAAAAQNDISAKKLMKNVSKKVKCCITSFDAALVASKANVAHWPGYEDPSVLQIKHGLMPLLAHNEDEADCVLTTPAPTVVHHISHMWDANPKLDPIPTLQLPSDQLLDFIVHVMRTEVHLKNYNFSSGLRKLFLLPSLGRTVTLMDVLKALAANHHLVGQLRTVVLSGQFAEVADAQDMQSFVQAASQLTEFSAPYTKFDVVGEWFIPVLKDSMVRVLNLEGNDLGLLKDESDIIPLLAEYIKYNKFLMEINLSYNNIGGESAKLILEALVRSDTRLYPHDVEGEGDFVLEDTADALDLESVSYFYPDGEHMEDEEELSEESEEDEISEGERKGKSGSGGEGLRRADDETEEEEEEEGVIGEVVEGNEDNSDVLDEESDEVEEGSEEDEEGEGKEKSLSPRLVKKFRRLFRSLRSDEKKERVKCIEEYYKGTRLFVDEHRLIREELAEEQRIKVEKYCKRRSGWSHIQVLRLRGNPIGNLGAKSVADVLRHEMALEEEEEERIQKELSDGADNLANKLLLDREKAAVEEFRERKRIKADFHTALAALKVAAKRQAIEQREQAASENPEPKQKDDSEGGSDEEGESEEGNAILDGEESYKILEASNASEEEDNEVPENLIEEDAAVVQQAIGNWEISFLPSKRGLPYIRLIDVGSCQIGSAGLKSIAHTLAENTTLEVLLLRHNTFARKRVALPAEEGDGVEEGTRALVDVPHFISSGCTSLFSALMTNTTLKVLDLAYNDMYPATIRALANALACNKTVTTLSLEGNRIGFNASTDGAGPEVMKALGYPVEEDVDNRPSCLLELFKGISEGSITTLLLGHNDLSQCWGQEETEALVYLCGRIKVLHLNSNGLTPAHITQWANALPEVEFTLKELQLSRNPFEGVNNGVGLSRLLRRCKQSLEKLSLDETQLGSAGMLEAFGSFKPLALKSLSIRNLGVTEAFSFSRSVMAPLHELLVSDNPFDEKELMNLVNLLCNNAKELVFLSLWSREVDMDAKLPELLEAVRRIPSLLFVDFGVLLRFDDIEDAKDPRGQIEALLTARRIAQIGRAVETECL